MSAGDLPALQAALQASATAILQSALQISSDAKASLSEVLITQDGLTGRADDVLATLLPWRRGRIQTLGMPSSDRVISTGGDWLWNPDAANGDEYGIQDGHQSALTASSQRLTSAGPWVSEERQRAAPDCPIQQRRGRRSVGRWLLCNASDSQVRLQAAGDRAGSKHIGDSRNRGKGGLRRARSRRGTADDVARRASGEQEVGAHALTWDLFSLRHGHQASRLVCPVSRRHERLDGVDRAASAATREGLVGRGVASCVGSFGKGAIVASVRRLRPRRGLWFVGGGSRGCVG